MLDIASPEQLDDIAFPDSLTIASCREKALAWLSAHDYQLVMPPLADYIETLTSDDEKLNLQTFKITDTLSQRTLGIRADQTPQIARFDSSNFSVLPQRRYCYCGPTLCTVPAQPWQSRERMQLGAELFGAPEGDGDWEVVTMALGTLQAMGIKNACLELGHAGLFAEITAALSPALRRQLAPLVSYRDAAAIATLAQQQVFAPPIAAQLQYLVQNRGSEEALKTAHDYLSAAAAATLESVWRRLSEVADCALNLSDLGSYGYHSGVVFNIYTEGYLIVRGGRYRRSGSDDGTGFSLDLRAICNVLTPPPPPPPVRVPLAPEDSGWRAAVAALQSAGRRLRFVYHGEDTAPPVLYRKGKEWIVQES